jgi:hypothetical protein
MDSITIAEAGPGGVTVWFTPPPGPCLSQSWLFALPWTSMFDIGKINYAETRYNNIIPNLQNATNANQKPDPDFWG